jgi:hypothetical protein
VPPSSSQYDQLCRSLNNGQPLTSLAEFHRAGYLVVSHIAGPTTDGGWRVVGVWESEEALGRFRHELMPLLEQVGIPGVAPQVLPVHTSSPDSHSPSDIPAGHHAPRWSR